ncbi:hypothetical protein J6590_014188 [Homalodisca vitripennis]|nr:hypothetical protein J6590_014188 [Homalodisca vitripennis]
MEAVNGVEQRQMLASSTQDLSAGLSFLARTQTRSKMEESSSRKWYQDQKIPVKQESGSHRVQKATAGRVHSDFCQLSRMFEDRGWSRADIPSVVADYFTPPL